MKHTRVSLRVHCIFSTKDRRPAIPETLQARTWAFIGGIARNLGMKAIAVGGMADHAHVLLLLPPTIPLAEAVQKHQGELVALATRAGRKALSVAGGIR
ncbi:MAG: transposase, partial [Terriglobales bacterium]